MITYINGNYKVELYPDGTKVRSTPDTFMEASYPETIDINISNKCDNNCAFCYLDATEDGLEGDLNMDMFDNIKPYTELAINYAEHPMLLSFLLRMKHNKIIVNMTINYRHLQSNMDKVKYWIDNKLITGLGISVPNTITNSELRHIRYLGDNVVFHTIVGITPKETFEKLSIFNAKVLVLGFKEKGRGRSFNEDIPKTYYDIGEMLRNNWFKVLSFDNLALEQLDIQNRVSDEEWDRYYMGSDGEFSMYIDTVKKIYSLNSLSDTCYDIGNKTIKDMFEYIKKEATND